MANKEHLRILMSGYENWVEWRSKNLLVKPDLRGANLVNADLHDAALDAADLSGAKLLRANLAGADLRRASLRGAQLHDATLHGAYLQNADLREAFLTSTNLSGARLQGADVFRIKLLYTVFGNTDLSGVLNLHRCVHYGPSTIDYGTIQRSGMPPKLFLRGCGLPENFIEYLPSLLEQPIQYYSCFISYSSKDEEFAKRLHADLEAQDVPCWFAPEDMKIGDKIRDRIDQAIRVHDKLLLILSEHSVASDWVETEVERAFSEERRKKSTVLFPVRLDGSVLDANKAWASQIYDTRHIGDFTKWKDHDSYQKGLDRLLRDLKTELEKQPIDE